MTIKTSLSSKSKNENHFQQIINTISTQTEGPWDEVMRIIGQAHTLLHANGVVRIQSDIRVGSSPRIMADTVRRPSPNSPRG